MPRMDDILIKVNKAKYISKIDLTKGYWQFPLDEDAKCKILALKKIGIMITQYDRM